MGEMDSLCKIRDIYRAIAAFESEFEKHYDLSLNEGMLFCTLSKAKTLSSGELADALGLSCSNASKVIRSVEEKAFAQRVLGKVDKRQMYFSLTPQDADILSRIKCGELNLPEILLEVVQDHSAE